MGVGAVVVGSLRGGFKKVAYGAMSGLTKTNIKIMEIYKNWEIRKSDYGIGYFEAVNLNNCDAFMKYGKRVDDIKAVIFKI